jgi:hypothetical protein
MDNELEPEILSYREFRNRQTLLAWEQRRRAIESPPGSGKRSPNSDGDPARWRPAYPGGASPQTD